MNEKQISQTWMLKMKQKKKPLDNAGAKIKIALMKNKLKIK